MVLPCSERVQVGAVAAADVWHAYLAEGGLRIEFFEPPRDLLAFQCPLRQEPCRPPVLGGRHARATPAFGPLAGRTAETSRPRRLPPWRRRGGGRIAVDGLEGLDITGELCGRGRLPGRAQFVLRGSRMIAGRSSRPARRSSTIVPRSSKLARALLITSVMLGGAHTSVINARSRRVMEKLQMRRDPADDFEHPRVPPGDPLRDHVLYRLRRCARTDEHGSPLSKNG